MRLHCALGAGSHYIQVANTSVQMLGCHLSWYCPAACAIGAWVIEAFAQGAKHPRGAVAAQVCQIDVHVCVIKNLSTLCLDLVMHALS